jgi:hypothetical protein
LELAAIVYALKMWRHYLLGRIFVLIKDHCGLNYLFVQPWLNVRKAKWMVLIGEFDFEIKHIKRKENRVADALSRSVQTLHFASTSVGESGVNHRIGILLQEDIFFNLAREVLKQEPIEKKHEGYQLTTCELLLYNNKMYVDDSIELKHLIMGEFHRRPYVGHPGYQKVITIMRQLYYWIRMK